MINENEEFQCMCCYCESKGTPHNAEYIRGIQFAVEYLVREWAKLAEGVDRNRSAARNGKITERQLKSYNDHCESKMRILGEWHDILAKEGNKSIKLIKDIDWKEYLYGDHE